MLLGLRMVERSEVHLSPAVQSRDHSNAVEGGGHIHRVVVVVLMRSGVLWHAEMSR